MDRPVSTRRSLFKQINHATRGSIKRYDNQANAYVSSSSYDKIIRLVCNNVTTRKQKSSLLFEKMLDNLNSPIYPRSHEASKLWLIVKETRITRVTEWRSFPLTRKTKIFSPSATHSRVARCILSAESAFDYKFPCHLARQVF